MRSELTHILASQYLEEDPRVNRIDDSLQLFTSICQNKIFKDVHLVLMLNKVRRRSPRGIEKQDFRDRSPCFVHLSFGLGAIALLLIRRVLCSKHPFPHQSYSLHITLPPPSIPRHHVRLAPHKSVLPDDAFFSIF